ncbi:MAG: hypothetical protein P8Z30_09735 [Acidobacteriota bacterium]
MGNLAAEVTVQTPHGFASAGKETIVFGSHHKLLSSTSCGNVRQLNHVPTRKVLETAPYGPAYGFSIRLVAKDDIEAARMDISGAAEFSKWQGVSVRSFFQ